MKDNDWNMSDEGFDYSKGLSGEPPPFGASNSHWSGWGEYQNRISSFTSSDLPANSAGSVLTSSELSAGMKFFSVLCVIEAGTLGWQLGRAMLGDGAIFFAVLFTVGYLGFVAGRARSIWFVVPRLLFWSLVIVWAESGSTVQLYWRCLVVLIIDSIVAYNGYKVAREEESEQKAKRSAALKAAKKT